MLGRQERRSSIPNSRLPRSTLPPLVTGAEAPSLNFDMAQRYLELLGGGDVPHLFQPYYDPRREGP